MSKTKVSSTASLTTKLDHLHAAVEWFYGPEFSLDQASEHYQAALELAGSIEADLQHLKNQIEVLTEDFSKQSATLQSN